MDDEKSYKILEEPILRKLIKNSFFTKNQLVILLDYIHKKRENIQIKTENNKIQIEDRTITRETYYKIVRSAKKKIAQTIVTLMLLTSLNILSQEQIVELLDITSQSLDEDLIERLIDKIKFGHIY